MKKYDVIIAGGAMAGATLALAIRELSQQTLSIAVVEAYQVDHHAHPGFDSRSIALSAGTVAILKKLNLWSSIEPVATAIDHIHVSDQTHLGITNINKQALGIDALGYVVELADIGEIYQGKMDADSGIELLCPDSVTHISREPELVTVELDSGQSIQGKLLVAADGAMSTCCEQIGIEMLEHDFEQSAVIANVVSSEPHNHQAFERFTKYGPLALLPMSDNRLSLVWCLSPDLVTQVLSMDDDEFLLELQSEFGWRLGQLTKVGSRATYPLLLRYRSQNISHRFAIVGNAAQTLHPIAGQGFNLGIRDVASLAEEIAFSSEDPGSYETLVAYRKRRENDREDTISMTSQLVHTFSNDLLSMRVGRNLALVAMDNLPVLKTPLLRRTLGIVQR
ncbi:2-octaprenyl-6-methoxyphenyl hydroxylase [Vibrio sp. 10N.261.55.A7]|uniref:2-octaprenyl-6-methoxyphenyl hydroxylase n=1 Tax=Vibrio sp. 10N.261.55.A7 TaxID=1880851 RepID=UPI000C859CAA|nr:2-octaprenyl-6-methoxyphenyl hydroxylase [Vibrio sp. 10N.261.55.A7]PMJ90044.1 2-octaprenyl-6-methoxyphenyl hydroxylase [Vibrio sp. 10N.261.55.A7]